LILILYLFIGGNTFEDLDYEPIKSTLLEFCDISFIKEPEMKIDPKPPSAEEVERQTSALLLQELTGGTVELDVCYKALQLTKDNLEQAANLLFENRDRVMQQIKRKSRNDKLLN